MITAHPTRPGVFLVDEKTGGENRDDEPCPVLILLSKSVNGKIDIWPQRGQPCPCECDHPQLNKTIRTYQLGFHGEWRFGSRGECDEVRKAAVLDGCYMVVKGSLKLRDHICHDHMHTPAGLHEDQELVVGCQQGEFIIYRPVDPADPTQGFTTVFIGDLTGTVGLDPWPDMDHPSCCQPEYIRGMLKGRGVDAMRGCEFCATYDARIHDLNGVDLCQTNRLEWGGDLEGTVCCPCPDKKSGDSQKKDA